MLSFVCNPSWFAPNISLRRMHVANLCLYLPMLHVSFLCSKLLNFFTCGLIKALPELLFVVVVLISTLLFSSYCSCLFFGFPPVYIIEHIPKYNSIEKFIKLPFQRVLIHLNLSPYEGVMAVSLQLCLLSRNFQDVQSSVIRPYLLVGTSDRFDSWLVGRVTSWGF